jgi:hypothetical protein
MRLTALLFPALAGLALLGAAAPAPPPALSGVAPGLWEVSRSATGHDARAMCLRDVVELASAGNPGETCATRVLESRSGMLLLDLSCPRGDFARSRISVVTPRSLKVETMGLHRGAPFDLTLYARRKGACPQK